MLFPHVCHSHVTLKVISVMIFSFFWQICHYGMPAFGAFLWALLACASGSHSFQGDVNQSNDFQALFSGSALLLKACLCLCLLPAIQTFFYIPFPSRRKVHWKHKPDGHYFSFNKIGQPYVTYGCFNFPRRSDAAAVVLQLHHWFVNGLKWDVDKGGGWQWQWYTRGCSYHTGINTRSINSKQGDFMRSNNKNRMNVAPY